MPRFSSKSKWFLIFLTLVFLGRFLAADETTDKVDKIFAQWDTTTTPGAALAVIKDGQIIYKRGYGMAKIEDGIVMTPSKIFDIGSCSKQFTAACLAFLIRDGKVSPSDDIRKFFPEMPKYEKPITVDHLIHHTSGIRDYNGLLSLAGFRADSDCPNIDEALEVIFKQKRLNYPPGEEYSYTNSGFFLMGQIVERVSGKSLNEFAQEHIFRPLGMRHTIFQDDHLQIIKNRATGYDPDDKGGYSLDMSNWDETGDGNIYTSVEDLYYWDQAFYNFKLGKDLMDMLHTVGVLNNGKKIDYAFGLVIGEYKGLKTVSHGGAWAGFRAGIVRFPDQKFSAICLTNLATQNPSALCYKVADIYLADLLKEKPKEEKKKVETITLSKQELEDKAGNYQDEKFGMWITFSLKDDKLQVSLGRRAFPLGATSKTTFVFLEGPPITVEFVPDAKRKTNRVIVKRPEEDLYDAIKAAPVGPLTPAKLQEYAGDYVSVELLDARYRVVLDKDNLFIRFRSASKDPLKAMALDKFVLGGQSIEFVRSGGKKITGFRLSVGRAGGIEFVKK